MDTFTDRISIATGLTIEPIDEVEVGRLTYLSFRAHLEASPALADSDVVIAEVGGGSTELLFLEKGAVAYANTYRLGTMRMHEMLEDFNAPLSRQQSLMQSHIQQTVKAITQSITPHTTPTLIALGSDIRFAASQLLENFDAEKTALLQVKAVSSFTDNILRQSPNELVRKYHMPFPDAETIGQALLFYVTLARALSARQIMLTDISMRHGLLLELLGHSAWTEDFRTQIMHSALEVARKYHADEMHARHVAHLCGRLFDILQSEHRLEPQWKLLLTVAALLHDIGAFVSNRSHHKHSMYLIRNSELFGLGKRDVLLVSLIARYHRRASPKPGHEGYMSLTRQDRLAVTKTAAILRVADALDRSYGQRVRDIHCSFESNRFVITVPGTTDLSLEQLALKNKGPMFEDVYGMTVVLRSSMSDAE